MNKKVHNERCQACKHSVKELLMATFGCIEANWDLDIPCSLEEYTNTKFGNVLKTVHDALQKYRNFDHFIRSSKLPRVDYFIPGQNLIVEFDESQHFTKPREIALSHYPNKLQYGFSIEKWRKLCQKLNKRDNDPPYRDEQRAWYDTLRDFAPKLWDSGQTIRLYSKDLTWCSLNSKNKTDLASFKQIIMNGKTVNDD